MRTLGLVIALTLLGCTSVAPGPGPGPDPDPDPPPVEPGVWGTAAMLHDLPGYSHVQALRVDRSGRAVVIWEQTHPDAPRERLWASRQTAGGWEAPVMVTADSNVQGEIALAGEVGSRLTAAWRQSYAGQLRIVAGNADAAGAWTTPVALDTTTWELGHVLDPRLAADAAHDAVVWARYDQASQRYTLTLRTRKAGASWAEPSPVASGVSLAVRARPLYDVAMDDAGAVVVTWGQRGADTIEILTRRGTPVEGSLSIAWEPTRRLAALPAGNGQQTLHELWTGSHAGRSFAAWLSADAAGDLTITTSHARPDGEWVVESQADGIRSSHYGPPRFAAGDDGHKIVVWREALEESSRMMARTYDPDGGWQPAEVAAGDLHPPYFGCIDIDAYYHDVAIDSGGNAIAIWEERLDEQLGWRSAMSVWSSQYLVGAGWQPPVRVDAGGRHATLPVAALADGGTGVALFAVETEDGRSALATNQLAPAR